MNCCKFCIAKKGLKGSELKTCGYCFETEEELFNHIEMEHDLVIMREGETEEQATTRVKAKNPRLGTKDCRCPACLERRKVEATFKSHSFPEEENWEL